MNRIGLPVLVGGAVTALSMAGVSYALLVRDDLALAIAMAITGAAIAATLPLYGQRVED